MFNNKYIRREFFFFFDKLQITKNERNIVAVLIILIVTIHIFIQIGQLFDDPIKISNDSIDTYYIEGTHGLIASQEQYKRYYAADGSHSQLQSSTAKVIKYDPTNTTPVLLNNKKAYAVGDTIKNIVVLEVLNNGNESDLIQLPGIGKVTAGKIIVYREKYGLFKTIDELVNVSGIGPKKLAGITAYFDSSNTTYGKNLHSQQSTTPDQVDSDQESYLGLELLNNGNEYDLIQLPGIGKATAGKIIVYREKYGLFKTIDELVNVSGIGPKKLAGITAYFEKKKY